MGEGNYTPQSSEKVVDHVEKHRIEDNVERRDSRHNKTWIKGAEAVHSYTIPQTSLQLKHYTLLSSLSYPHLGISIPFIRCSSKNFCQTWGPTILHIQIPAFSFFTLTLLSPDFTLFTVFILVDEYLYFLFLHFQVTAVTRPCTGYLSSCPQNLQIR